MKEALAIRPSLGGTSFLKPRNITSVKIDPETGFLAGPTCPSAQTVNVAAQFAPYVECLKHRPPEPDLMEAYTTDLDSFESSGINTNSVAAGSVAAGSQQVEEDQKLSPDYVGTRGAEPKKTAHSVPNQTSKELNPRGRPILVSAPGIADQGSASNTVRVRP